MVADKVMLYALLLLGSRGGSADGKLGKDLTGVGVDNRCLQMFSDLKAEFCFADSFRTKNDN